MRPTLRTVLSRLGFSLLLASLVACGGTKQEAKAPAPTPETTAADVKSGSSAPDPASDTSSASSSAPSSSEGAKPQVASNKDDGSDIIPPFSTPKETKKSGATKAGKKKGSAKPKKKKEKET